MGRTHAWFLLPHHPYDTVLAPCRTAAWLEAVLSRPSFVETAPSYDCVMTGFGPFIAPMKD